MGLLRPWHGDVVRFPMHEKLLSIGDDDWIEDESGNKPHQVNGKVARIGDTWVLEGASRLATIRERKFSVRDAIKMEIGGREGIVKKALVGIRDRYHVQLDDGDASRHTITSTDRTAR